jgi:hypothetical protein
MVISLPLSGRVIGLQGAFSKNHRQNVFDSIGAEPVSNCNYKRLPKRTLKKSAQ